MPALDIRMVDNSSSQHRTQVCRINDLPYDVFYLILVMCWDDAQGYRRDKILHFPVIASHVCRIWRQLVISTPSSWAKLSFQSRISQFEKYQEWLTRLRGAAFDVHIGQEPFTRASVKHAKSIMRLIMPHWHIFHLRSFRVSYVPTKILRLIFDRLSDANAPLLQTLRVDMLSGGVQGNCEPRPFHRGQVPNLRNVRLDAMPYGYIMDCFDDTLSDFIIVPGIRLGTHHDRVKFVQEILLRAPHLRVFGYIRVGNWEPDNHNQERKTFKTLSFLQ
ncbi:glycoside hydrolase family 61 protein [Tulasnella calospora MUT 4182]|uniref:Glycoside hydrolase family 61 protein n=1 Tax=Tulasnella calospora MUT 4182 TaxID=1051891 RepID=A0A0C3Q3H8_9AGAM|nr:glycoside hydrolase family 61 protein [Tulasnella calospora MUT 4182]